MQICLVSPATDTDLEDEVLIEREDSCPDSKQIPLGILALAAVLEKKCDAPQIVDLNLWYCEYIRSQERQKGLPFATYAACRLSTIDSSMVGFGTICSSYPLTVRIAEQVKAFQPERLILFGGPQASVVDVATLRHFSFVDLVLRGEADCNLPDLIHCLETGVGLGSVGGLTHRINGEIHRNPDSPIPLDLDLLPMPAFHLYPDLVKSRILPLEHGRGCPFGCKFCSTNDFFRRRFRLKSPTKVISEMDYLARYYSVEYFDLMHDMFTVDRRRVVEFCEALLARRCGHRWGCSARTDCVDEELLELMARAGCVSIFFGVETGSPRMQKLIDKKLDLNEARRSVDIACRNEMKTVVSMIVGFPEEEMDDVRASITFIARAMRNRNLDPHLHLLTPLAGTPLHHLYRDKLVLEEMYADLSHGRLSQDLDEREIIAGYPDLFSNFYSIPTRCLERKFIEELREFMARTTRRFRWMLVAWYDRCGDLLDLFEKWKAHRTCRQGPWRDWSDLRRYYCSWRFDRDFIEFLADRPSESRSEFETVLLNFEQELLQALRPPRRGVPDLPLTVIESTMRITLEDDVYILNLRGSIKRVVDLLSDSAQPDASIHDSSIVVTRAATGDEVEILEVSQTAADFLSLCDGETSVDDVLHRFAAKCDSVKKNMSSWEFAVRTLRAIYQQKLVRLLPASPGVSSVDSQGGFQCGIKF